MARVLVVDDDEGVRSFLAEALELSGHDVRQAGDGAEALGVLQRWAATVVLTDLKMPGVSGMELLATLRRDQPATEVIVLTAHGNVQHAVEAMKLGAFDFLQKPISGPAELRLVVERAVERHRLRAHREVVAPPTEGPVLTWGAPAMAGPVRALGKVAPTEATVLLLGASGVGKEVAARWVHARSGRAAGPFVAVNCATLSETLLESELFGHEKGAFTGATERRRGRIELAAGGTFFLDEVGELRLELQARLLRVLQERTFERVGGHQSVAADVRWIAATNRDLPAMIAEGTFREDLYHRLALFPVELPALAQRAEDVLPLARALLAGIAQSLGRPGLRLGDSAVAVLGAHTWPGNVRELANTLERAAILADSDVLGADDLVLGPLARRAARSAAGGPGGAPTMEQAERAAIEGALALHDGNRRKAAEHLGIGLRTLYDKLKRYGQD